MTMKFLIAGAGLAAIAAAAPATAQYGNYPPYGGNYGAPYGNAYGYYGNRANVTQFAANQCAAAVQARLNNRTGVSGILGTVLGANTASGRVLTITRVNPRGSTVRVSGLATSGRYAYYDPYGSRYYGALGGAYAQQPADLSFNCTVDYRGRIRDVDINRRR